ncbi:cupin domain-containing protein [Emticicia fluvialis]|uniref:cupin domain-containing protein n=1 Tax=Emticicia fluvialis TaxID=2974474 RepID=UPI0021652DDF|nr:cupin domain-containing protein [Emticicia fluvialis]
MKTAQYWIEKYQMQAHPEGGYFAENYRAAETIRQDALPKRFEGDRNFSTGIYFLLEGHQFSALHRIKSDEIWHFYYGSPLYVFYIDNQGLVQTIKLGNNPENGEVFQAVVPAGVWFGSKPAQADGFSLVGCTVAPGFDFADFELGAREKLVSEYPEHGEIIKMLTHQ